MDVQQDQHSAQTPIGQHKRLHDFPANLLSALKAGDDRHFVRQPWGSQRGISVFNATTSSSPRVTQPTTYPLWTAGLCGTARFLKMVHAASSPSICPAMSFDGRTRQWAVRGSRTDATVAFVKRKTLASVAARESHLASILFYPSGH